ncbi:MAG: cobaltochelatase CobT [Gammaproteobacteria bacterium]|jgi:cobaltochelatase CobT
MSSDSGAVYQQQVEELCAASARAITGSTNLHYRSRRLYVGDALIPIRSPHLKIDFNQDDFQAFRGVSDAISLRLKLSDANLHESLQPESEIESLLFELLEQLRVESLVSYAMPGVERNIKHRFEQWCRRYVNTGMADTEVGILMYGLIQVCWARLNICQVLEETEDLIESTRWSLAPLLGHEFAAITRTRENQSEFSIPALSIAAKVADRLKSFSDDDEDSQEENDRIRAIFNLLLNSEEETDDAIGVVNSGQSKVLSESEVGYRVFTREFDRQVRTSDLVRNEQLQELRQKLDQRVSQQGINVPRLARLFQRLLAQPVEDDFDFGRETGYIDGSRLSQLVSSPAERRLFKQHDVLPKANCGVSFLLDCSGSMKQHANHLTVLVDVMSRALELVGIKNEILGFTTNNWAGGKAQKQWLSSGRPALPGRLNETCHMVMKEFDTPWRRARDDIAALLKQDLFREGVDGEAVDWAANRLQGQDFDRRILIVFSDGSPMDTATNLANDSYYLDHHLQQVVAAWEQHGGVEIYGFGVGLDLSPYYRRSIAVDLSESMGNQVLFDLVELLRGHHQR